MGQSASRRVARLLAASLCMLACDRSSAPLSSEERALFHGSPEDPPAEVLDSALPGPGEHHVHGNEWSLHLFAPAVRDLRGGYVGVGADQAYLFLSWQDPELAWLIDYDTVVIDVHRIHQAFLSEARTPAEFVSLWQPGAASARAVLARAPGPPSQAVRLADLHARSAASVADRLARVRREMETHGVPSYLTDQAAYSRVRALVAQGRVRTMSADLLGQRGLRGIGDAARALGVRIRVLYLSNAEQYWLYSPTFRDNIASLFFDDRSLVLRTLLSSRPRPRPVRGAAVSQLPRVAGPGAGSSGFATSCRSRRGPARTPT